MNQPSSDFLHGFVGQAAAQGAAAAAQAAARSILSSGRL